MFARRASRRDGRATARQLERRGDSRVHRARRSRAGSGQVVGDTTLATGAALDLEAVDQINDIEEATTRTVADARTSYGDGQMRLSRSDSTDHNDVALIGDERATGKVADQVFVDGCTGEVEVIDIFCQR